MADACLACHTGVGDEITAKDGLHGRLKGMQAAPTCTGCHPEHNGPDGALTVLDEAGFGPQHDLTGFSLKTHQKTDSGGSFTCADCHPDGYAGAYDQALCADCHAEIDAAFMKDHEAAFGKDCLGCHDGTGNTSVDHDKFAFKLTGKHAAVPCEDCHKDARSLKEYQRRADGLLRVPRQGRRARRRLRPGLRQLPLRQGLGRRHLRPQGLPPRPRRRGAEGHLPDLPPRRHRHLHLLRLPRAHGVERDRRARGQVARRAAGLRALPRGRRKRRGRRLTSRAAATRAQAPRLLRPSSRPAAP